MRAQQTLSLAVILAAFLACFAPGAALADGLIVITKWHGHPHPVPRPHRPPTRHYTFAPLAVEYHHVDVAITDQVATTSVDQVFYNPNNARLEGHYIFPIPKGAQIDKFSMDINGKQVEAELLDADKARKIYEDIVRSMKDPALLEYAGQGMFKVRIFPIEPHSKKRVKIKYTQVLSRDSNLIGYTYPLNTEKFSSQPVKSVSVKVALECQHEIKSLYSPSHKVEVKRHGTKKAVIGFEAKNVKPDTDFQVFYSLAPKNGADIGLSLLAYNAKGDGEKEGYFMLLASPGVGVDDKKIAKKDVVFVMDTSGSMAGEKLEQAKKALLFCIENLNKGDRFEIVRFSTEAEALFDGMVENNKANREKAQEFIDSLKPIGGTAIAEALTDAVDTINQRAKAGSRPAVVIFLTDGRPTIGTTDEDQIVKAVAKQVGDATVRVFSFGIGTDINTHLLDKLTEKTKAFSQYVLPTEDIEVKVSNFYTKINHPVLADVKLKVSGVKVSKVYPSPLPDLFKGDQLIMMGRYQETASGGAGAGTDAAVILEGNVGGKATKVVFEATFPAAGKATEHAFVPKLWATRRVGYLLDEIRLNGESKELRDEVTRLARQYAIVTPYTAYLIVEDERRRNVPALSRTLRGLEEGRREVLADAAKGFAEQYGGSLASRRKAGDEAVSNARAQNLLKQAENAADLSEADRSIRLGQSVSKARAAAPSAPASGLYRQEAQKLDGADPTGQGQRRSDTQQVRFVKGKNFYRNGAEWIDADVQANKDAKRLEVKFDSPEYYKLLNDHPEAIQWLSVGQQVQFVHKNQVIQVR